jgi:hypothetical protein
MLARARRAARSAAAVSFAALSVLHVAWAFGSAWPAADRERLADAIGGFKRLPGRGACISVAALLAVGSACAGSGVPRDRTARAGSAATSLVLFARAGLGFAGALPNINGSDVFAELDRRCYSPICLVLATLSLAGISRD